MNEKRQQRRDAIKAAKAAFKALHNSQGSRELLRENEDLANSLSISCLFLAFVLMVLFVILRLFNVFAVPISSLIACVIPLGLQVALCVILYKTKFKSHYLFKYIIFGFLQLIYFSAGCILSPDVKIVFILPIVMSCLYLSVGFTIATTLITNALMIVASIIYEYNIELNLNFVKLSKDVTNIPVIYPKDTFIVDSVMNVDIDWFHTMQGIFNMVILPNILLILFTGVIATIVTARARKLLVDHDAVVRKEASYEAELKLASDIQTGLLPRIFPAFPERTDFDIYASMNAAKETGGDFYDFFLTGPDSIAMVIADVSGKGAPAAMFMSTAITSIKIYARMGLSPAEVFTVVNNYLTENNEGHLFVTAWLGILDTTTGVLTFSSAGHNPQLLTNENGEFEYFRKSKNLFLAGMEGTKYREDEITLKVGDRLFLYTDGVTEANDPSNAQYGEDRLRDYLNENKDSGLEDVLKGLFTDIQNFAGEAPQFDDITMLMMEYKGK